jgi:hypothetical protein
VAKGWVEERLKGLGTGVLYVVRDRAQALIPLAEQGLECWSRPDFLHVVHAIVKSYALALGQRWRHAQQDLTPAKEPLARRQGRRHAEPATRAASVRVEARPAEVRRWAEASTIYRGALASLSLTLPPFRLSDSPPQTSAPVASQLTAAGEAIEALALGHQGPARHEAMSQVRQQVPALAALVAFWWQGGHRALEPFLLAPRWRQWGHECPLPMVDREYQVERTRGRRRQATLPAAWPAVPAAFDRHLITQRLAPRVLEEGHA